VFSYIKKHLFAKLGLLFLIASFSVAYFSYYISVYWVNLQQDDIIDAQEAYFAYKLIESWGLEPDTAVVAEELQNLHLLGMIYYMDEDTTCLNDTLKYWSNAGRLVSPGNYFSVLDTDILGEKYDIDFKEWVSFGETTVNERPLETIYVEFSPYKYFLISDHVRPRDVYTLLPSVVLSFILMALLFFLVRQFLAPISLIEKRIKGLEGGDLDSQIPVVGSDELAVLSQKFNHLVLDIKDLLKQKERLLAVVSHELRTPLAKIRLLLAMIPRHAKVEAIDKQIYAIDSMITNILMSDKMASAYSNLNLEEISPKELIDKSIDLTFVKKLNIKIKDNASLNVDVVKTSIAIKNLIENADKYGGNNKSVFVVGRLDGANYKIDVIDSGGGIPENKLNEITKAFVRLEGAKKSGFGLGLSICHKVAAAHGGSLDIKNNESGVGSCFTLCFPVK